MVCAALRRILQQCKAIVLLLQTNILVQSVGTHIIIFVLGEHLEEFFQEENHLISHVLELMNVAVCIDIAEACPNRIVDEKDVGEFVPRSIIVSKG